MSETMTVPDMRRHYRKMTLEEVRRCVAQLVRTILVAKEANDLQSARVCEEMLAELKPVAERLLAEHEKAERAKAGKAKAQGKPWRPRRRRGRGKAKVSKDAQGKNAIPLPRKE